MKTWLLTMLATACMTSTYAQQTLQQELAGEWTITASPFEGGADEISFTATVADDGTSLNCHAEQFHNRASQPYPMDWTLAVEQDGDKVRVGWKLDADHPASTKEFQEPTSKYALFGQEPDGTHRYIYLLTENIETQRLEPLTLWSEWMPKGSTVFSLPRTYQIYGVVSKEIPYNGAVGYMDIWASVKLTWTGQSQTLLGDANNDGTVNTADVASTISYILNPSSDNFQFKAADVNGDNVVNVADVIGIVDIILRQP